MIVLVLLTAEDNDCLILKVLGFPRQNFGQMMLHHTGEHNFKIKQSLSS
jgi:hypothetical protein